MYYVFDFKPSRTCSFFVSLREIIAFKEAFVYNESYD